MNFCVFLRGKFFSWQACGGVRSEGDLLPQKELPPSTRFVYPEEMWQKLVEYDKGNYLMACTATNCKKEIDCGMVHGHAYSILWRLRVSGWSLVEILGDQILNGMDLGVIEVPNGGIILELQKP